MDCYNNNQGTEICVRWKVPDPWSFSRSPVFNFRGREWNLTHSLENASVFCLLLWCRGNHIFRRPSLKSFHATVHLESGSDIVEGFTNRTNNVTSSESHTLWRKDYTELCGVTGPWRVGEDTLNFRVILKVDEDEILADSTSVTYSSSSIPGYSQNPSVVAPRKNQLTKQKPDLEFRCGGHSIMAHRSVVCAQSPVIASKLLQLSPGDAFHINDVQPEIFQQLIRYLYSNSGNWSDHKTIELAMSLYQAADKYGVTSLTIRCSEFLYRNLTVENACDVLAVAYASAGASQFVEKVVEFMAEKKVPSSVSGERWRQFCLSHQTLAMEVLRRCVASTPETTSSRQWKRKRDYNSLENNTSVDMYFISAHSEMQIDV